MNKLKELLQCKQNVLASKLSQSIALTHPVSKGDNSEETWRNFFSEMLPGKYRVTNGFVMDYEGNVSEQIDIIIYDGLYAPYVMIDDAGIKYVPAESVYAVIEIKQTINANNFKYASKKILSVTRLKRSRRGVTCAGRRTSKANLTNILGVILATDSKIKTDEKMEEHLNNYKNIDIVCAVNDFTYLSNKNSDGTLNIEHTSKDESLLGLFFYLNNELYELGTVAGMDIREYANALDSFNYNTEEDFRNNE